MKEASSSERRQVGDDSSVHKQAGDDKVLYKAGNDSVIITDFIEIKIDSEILV